MYACRMCESSVNFERQLSYYIKKRKLNVDHTLILVFLCKKKIVHGVIVEKIFSVIL